MSRLSIRAVSSLVSVLALACATDAIAGPVFDATNYSADITFNDALSSTTMTITYDGSNYWSSSGGSASGIRYARYDASGNVLTTYSPGIDFRSVFTDGGGAVYARGFASNTIYKQTGAGVFSSYLSLSGGSLYDQSSVVLNNSGNYVAFFNGEVSLWGASGAYLSSFLLSGYSGLAYPQNRGIFAVGDDLFTYDGGVLSAWDYSGNLLDQTVLTGAGTLFDSYFSLSYANDHVFIVDSAQSVWRGYNIGLGGTPGNIPEPAVLGLVGIGLLGVFATKRRRKE